jgi:hypothetical protein
MRPLGLRQERREAAAASDQPVGVQLPSFVGIDLPTRTFEPARGQRRGDRAQPLVGQLGLQQRGSARELRRPRQQHVALYFTERIVDTEALQRGLPGLEAMVEIQRRAVIDEERAPVPQQKVRVPRRTIDVRHERVQQHGAGGLEGVHGVARAPRDTRIERDAARQIVEPEVQPGAAVEGRENLRVGLRRGERAIQIDEHQLRHGEAECSADLTRDELRDQRLLALPGAAQLDNVKTQVVGFDQRGHGAALAERHHVPLGADGAKERARHPRQRSRTRCERQEPSFS